MGLNFVPTKDTSLTLYSSTYQAHYHSVHGAIEESMHVFISAGLFYQYRKQKKQLSIFEMGFGTGLNALLSFIEGQNLKISIDYYSIEKHPISEEQASKLNYPQILGREYGSIFEKMHASAWNKTHIFSPLFKFTKLKDDLISYSLMQDYDLVYYDAFAPSAQSELWGLPIHKKIYNALNPGAILTTYCSQGQFRRNLTEIGYRVEKLNGPGGKREMLRALKP